MDNEEPRKLLDFLDHNSGTGLKFPSTMDALLDYLAGYVSTMEDLLEKKRIEARKRHDNADDVQVRDYLEEEIFITENFFPNLLRSSCFLTIYSLFEDSLRKRCLCIQKTKKPPVLLEVIARKRYIDQYKNYLEKSGGIDIEKIGEWKKLLIYGELRNCIAHNQGHLNLSNTNLLRFIARNPSLDKENDEVILKKGFCEEVIKAIGSFFQSLDAQLPTECQNLEPHFGYRP